MAAATATLCTRVVCAVEPSPAGLDTLERARRLVAPGGVLVALTAYERTAPVVGGWPAAVYLPELRAAAEETAEEATRRLAGEPRHRAVVREGPAIACIRRELRLLDADLAVVGTHGHGRASGIVSGSVSTALLHDAPCPVLLARPVGPPARFPQAVVVGVDGSRRSHEALAFGRVLASRLGVPVRAVVATGGQPVDHEGLVPVDSLEWLDGPPVQALAAAAGQEDLLVVGSRGLHGLAALGSVSERLAHEAPCSVLVVRRGDDVRAAGTPSAAEPVP
jgi:nucleotide-binding universal stress UspA family protein